MSEERRNTIWWNVEEIQTAFSFFFFFSLSFAHLRVYSLHLILGLCDMFIFIFTVLFHLFELFYEDSQSRIVALDLGEKEQISL